MFEKKPLSLNPRLVERVWGGYHLAPDASAPVGELWIVDENSMVVSGFYEGHLIKELAKKYPLDLLGSAAKSEHFPLLIKLLDCVDWLSVQVHPDDKQAVTLEGIGVLGKTEAWYVLDASPDAQLIAGVKTDISEEVMKAAIMQESIMAHVDYLKVSKGDSLLIPAGTVHAIGPNILLYEVQQSSNITYRLYDWGRPKMIGRSLHLDKGAKVARTLKPNFFPVNNMSRDKLQNLLKSEYFSLDRIICEDGFVECDTNNYSFHVFTVISGDARLSYGNLKSVIDIDCYQSLLIPACLGQYSLSGSFEGLISRLP